jgi:hypothetical protein
MCCQHLENRLADKEREVRAEAIQREQIIHEKAEVGTLYVDSDSRHNMVNDFRCLVTLLSHQHCCLSVVLQQHIY